MPSIVCLLRGVNVGGHHRILMADLRSLCEKLGHTRVQTYVQSGNVVFSTRSRNLLRVAEDIENAIESSHGFRSNVILRTTEELRRTVAASPVAYRDGFEPAKHIVQFLAAAPPDPVRDALQKLPPAPEELHLIGRELYIYFPNGISKSELSLSKLERLLKVAGTARNWNTVTKLLAIAEEMDA